MGRGMTAADDNAADVDAAEQTAPAEAPVTLADMWRLALAAHDEAAWWRRDRDVRTWAGVLRMIDACMYAKEGSDRDWAAEDRALWRRLREIAQARDVLKGYEPMRRPVDGAPA
jgi:hypothetical protein